MKDLAALTKELKDGKITTEEFQAELERQQAEKEAEQSRGIQKIEVAEKGGLKVKLNSQSRFPTTLYANQWVELLRNQVQIITKMYSYQKDLSFKAGQGLPEQKELVKAIIESLKPLAK